MNIAIIPARGGSKRIPKKNIKDFLGKPIIAYSIEAAIQSGMFDKVIVSTDDDNIAKISRLYGAYVPALRSAKNSDDYAPIVDVVNEVLDTLKCDDGLTPEFICCILATSPFVTAGRLHNSFEAMLSKNKDGIFPVVEFSYPIQRSLETKTDGTIGLVWPEYLLSRSQDLAQRYHDSGQYYWVRTVSLQQENTLFIKNCMAEYISSREAQDIDTEDDWIIAELKYKALQS